MCMAACAQARMLGLTALPSLKQAEKWLDNLYLKMPGGPLHVPVGKPLCERADYRQNPWCARTGHHSTVHGMRCMQAHGNAMRMPHVCAHVSVSLSCLVPLMCLL